MMTEHFWVEYPFNILSTDQTWDICMD